MKTVWAVVGIILGTALLSIALIVDIGVARTILIGNQSTSWTATTGVLLQSELEWAGRSTGRYQVLDLVYEYDVNGHEYRNDQYGWWSRPKSVTKWVAAHPVNTTITVYYDPDRPERSCLITGVKWNNARFLIGFVAFGSVLSMLGGFALVSHSCKALLKK